MSKDREMAAIFGNGQFRLVFSCKEAAPEVQMSLCEFISMCVTNLKFNDDILITHNAFWDMAS